MLDGKERNKAMEVIAQGLEAVVGSQMPPELKEEAHRLLIQLDRLQAELKTLTRSVSERANSVPRPA